MKYTATNSCPVTTMTYLWTRNVQFRSAMFAVGWLVTTIGNRSCRPADGMRGLFTSDITYSLTIARRRLLELFKHSLATQLSSVQTISCSSGALRLCGLLTSVGHTVTWTWCRWLQYRTNHTRWCHQLLSFIITSQNIGHFCWCWIIVSLHLSIKHALTIVLSKSNQIKKIYIAPCIPRIQRRLADGLVK